MSIANGTDSGAGANQSAENGAVPGRGSTRYSRREFGGGSPAGMYGPLRDTFELEEALSDAQRHEDVRIHVTHVLPTGAQTSIPTMTLQSFDWATISSTHGPGEYRIRIQARGQATPLHMLRLSIAPPAGTQLAGYAGMQLRPALPQQLPAAPSAPTQPLDLQALVLTQMQQQGQLMISLINNMSQPKSPELGTLTALLKIAKEFQGEQSQDDGMLKDLIGGIFAAAKSQGAQRIAPVRKALAHVAGAGPAGSQSPRPPSSQESNPPTPAGTAQTLPPASNPLSAFALLITRSNINTREAGSYAAIFDDNLSDGERTQLLSMPNGTGAQLLLSQFPELEPHAAFLGEVETELRAMYDNEVDDQQADTAPDTKPATAKAVTPPAAEKPGKGANKNAR